MNDCTKGRWKIDHHHIVDENGRSLAKVLDGTFEERVGNAHLIVSAVNACASVNPENPMAVAESIEPIYEALKYARAELIEFIADNYGGCDLFDIHMKQIIPIDEALAKADKGV